MFNLLNLSNLSYPLRKYRSSCIAFTLLVIFISLIAFFVGFSDDRGFSLKDYLVNTYIVGDFQSYERSFGEIINDIKSLLNADDLKSTGSIQGPIMPILIILSRFISNNFIPFFLISLYFSYWFIALTLDIARYINPWMEKNFSKKIFHINILNLELTLSYPEIFGFIVNPVFIFYVTFPASDLPFSCLVLWIIWLSCKEKYLQSFYVYLLSLLLRPTALFIFPTICLIAILDFKKNKKYRIFFYIFLIAITIFAFNYYVGYSVVNFEDTLKFGGYGGGLSVWGLPVPGWIIDKQNNLNLEINKISSIIFTPFIQIISTLGVRPSYTTIFDGDTESAMSIVSIKPYLYAYIRILWGVFISIPGLITFILFLVSSMKKEMIITLTMIFSFAIGLSSSIPLERYLLFAYPLISITSICTYIELWGIIKSNDHLIKKQN